MSLIRSALDKRRSLSITTVDDFAKAVADSFYYNGNTYTPGGSALAPQVEQTLGGAKAEAITNDFIGMAQSMYKSNGIVFACMATKQLAFSSVRFSWQRMSSGKPSELFSNPALDVLHQPWMGGTTQDLLSRAINDADLSGNSYWTRDGDDMLRLRPDCVTVVSLPRMRDGMDGRMGPLGDWQVVGYVYVEDGWRSGNSPIWLEADQVAHFAPIPDPLADSQVGMSPLTPIVREVEADQLMTKHRRRYFENGATPNMVIKHTVGADKDSIRRFASEMLSEYGGVDNAYKMLHLYPGADATVVGNSLEQIQFESVQAAGELRVANALGVPATVVGLMKGVDTSSYNNWRWARRSFSDGTLHPLWQNIAGSFAPLLEPDRLRIQGSRGVRLWYDARDVPLLHEDAKEAAEISEVQARTIRTYVDGGYTPESAARAVMANDLTLLQHTGMLSVQLQRPGERQDTQIGDNDG